MKRSIVALILALVATACGAPEWTAEDHAAVTLSCLAGAATYTDMSVAALLGTDVGIELRTACEKMAEELEEAGCDPGQAADIAEGVSFLSPAQSQARQDEC